MRYIIPLIVSAGLCYVLYSGVDWSEIADGLRNCRYRWIAAWFVANVAVILFRAVRWRLQLRAICSALRMLLLMRFCPYTQGSVFGHVDSSDDAEIIVADKTEYRVAVV